MSDTGYFESVSANLEGRRRCAGEGHFGVRGSEFIRLFRLPYCSWQKGATKEHRQTHKAIRAGKNGLQSGISFLKRVQARIT